MQPISPRFESSFNGKPWPRERPEFFDDNFHTFLTVALSIGYTFGVVVSCIALTTIYPTARLREKPWIPARARGDACLTPLFFVLPALLWPLTPGAFLVWNLVKSATTCCGFPLPRRLVDRDWNFAAAASSAPDLEMGPVVARAEDGTGSGPDGRKDDSTLAGVRSAGSGESQHPPSYTSLPPNEDEDDSGEADGLLAKSTSERVEMVGN
jgi:hypothetical protein